MAYIEEMDFEPNRFDKYNTFWKPCLFIKYQLLLPKYKVPWYYHYLYRMNNSLIRYNVGCKGDIRNIVLKQNKSRYTYSKSAKKTIYFDFK